MSSMTPVGIDLGTTNCAVAYIDADGSTRMLANADGDSLTPSLVYYSDDEILVGRRAQAAGVKDPGRLAENAKRDMGTAAYRRQIGGDLFPAEVIQGSLLRHLRERIVAAFGDAFQTVVTVPAYFDEARRNATHDAAVMSGLPVLDIVNEPTAAALAFGERLGYLSAEGAPRERLTLLVYDLGGGTFDVTLIRLGPGEVRTLATDGDYELGGLNWDQRIVEFAKSRLGIASASTSHDSFDEREWMQAARDAKHALSETPAAVMVVGAGRAARTLPLTREEVEEATADLLERTLVTTRLTLAAAGLLWEDVDRVLLTGGASRMPAVRRALHGLSERLVETLVNPDEAVARGAAIFSRYLLGRQGLDSTAPKLRITDVNAHGLGIVGVNLQTCRKENVTLIPRNTPLPFKIARSFVTRVDNQPNVKVELTEGESSVTSQCSSLASAKINHLPPGLPKGTEIEVCYELQANGRLAVTAQIPGCGDSAQIELQRLSGLADQRVKRWRRVICRDGGFRDLHEALAVMAVEATDPKGDEASENAKSAAIQPTFNTNPAVDYGAPLAAAEALKGRQSQTHDAQTRPAPQEPSTESDQGDASVVAPRIGTSSMRVRRRRRRRRGLDLGRWIAGHVVAAAVGLAVGYYLLCLLRPDLNYLGLELPGVQPPENPERSTPALPRPPTLTSPNSRQW